MPLPRSTRRIAIEAQVLFPPANDSGGHFADPGAFSELNKIIHMHVYYFRFFTLFESICSWISPYLKPHDGFIRS
ncbi:Protein of unknown function [Azospirillum lipoferum 4B]|uniref:Uncharacterized protein n=1 Tax=Azospirillum lipoferum (strain 4B) TaxID=862719 RepID=G7Z9I7_AZOL4|nr:Protein of unknown function [Azospirillum lipoferum 4B]